MTFFYVCIIIDMAMCKTIVINQPKTEPLIMPCLQGYVKTTYSQLVEKLGEPTYKREGTYSNPTENDGDGKTSTEFGRAFDDSFYVYDWKLDETPMKEHWWHIGGETQQCLKDFEVTTGLKATSNYNFYPY